MNKNTMNANCMHLKFKTKNEMRIKYEYNIFF